MSIDTVALGRTIEDALNDLDESELVNVINAMTHEQMVAIMECVPEHKGGVYSLTPEQWEGIAKTLQGNSDARRY